MIQFDGLGQLVPENLLAKRAKKEVTHPSRLIKKDCSHHGSFEGELKTAVVFAGHI